MARLLGKSAFGYEPAELEGKSILGILHPADHRPFAQTACALIAMAAGAPPGADAPPQSVRALHRVSFRRHSMHRSRHAPLSTSHVPRCARCIASFFVAMARSPR